VPYSETAFIGRIRAEGKVFSEECAENGTLVDALVDIKLVKRAEEFEVE
jgi:GTP-binding protein HflX